MKRKDFLKGLGALGVTLPLAGFTGNKLIDPMDEPSNNEVLLDCTTSPSETAGPYPAPNSVSTSTLLRTNITEGQEGVPLSLTITINNTNNDCNAVGAGYRVDVWHCNKRGYYSAYSGQPGIDGTQDTSGETWLRGIQYTDSNGQVNFTTIYPGWYMPRATHLHVQVYDASNSLLLTTQLAFPDAVNTTVNNFYNTSGTNSHTNSNDMVFSDSIDDQLMSVTGNTTDGYSASGSINVPGNTLSIDEFSSENGGQFSATIVPNPIVDASYLSINLIQPSNVTLEIVDVTGKSIKRIAENDYSSGQNKIDLGLSNISSGIYFCRIKVKNISGEYVQTKKIIKD